MSMNNYQWLAAEPAPRHLVEAVKLYGTEEFAGVRHNRVILSWAQECGIPGYNADEIPWCGLFMAVIMKRANRPFVTNPLWARAWARWGDAVTGGAMLADVLVFSRQGGGGHVGLYVGEDSLCYHVLGGNQGNAVNVTRILKSRCIAIRRAPYNNQPANVRRIELAVRGAISENEA